jgi:predicted NBD/HSP70 family sugar kinase
MYDLGLIIGEACGTLVSLYNPRTLLIGGAGGTAGELFRDPVELRLRQRLIPEMLAGLTVDFAPHEAEDEALGAAMIAEQSFWQTLDLQAARRLVPQAREGRR